MDIVFQRALDVAVAAATLAIIAVVIFNVTVTARQVHPAIEQGDGTWTVPTGRNDATWTVASDRNGQLVVHVHTPDGLYRAATLHVDNHLP